MDPMQNPFSPGAGAPPPELVGRDHILEEARILVGRILNKKAEQNLLLTGLRGVGKTVLLNEIIRQAQHNGCQVIAIEASEGKSLGSALAPLLKKTFYALDRLEGRKESVRKGLIALRNFIGTIKINIGDIGLDIEPLSGLADTGDIEVDLIDLFECAAQAAEEKGSAIILVIDEIQYLSSKELGALIMALHAMQQRSLPFALVGAGLPTLPGLAGNAKSYAERLFRFPSIGALSRSDLETALVVPFKESGVDIEKIALDEIYTATLGYPYFVQEWGYQLWNLVSEPHITPRDIESARERVQARLDRNFFTVRMERLTNGEKKFLRTMASFHVERVKIAELALRMGVSSQALSPRRSSLIKKGMIYSPTHGDIAFTVPLFDGFMLRAMPMEAREEQKDHSAF